MTINGDGFAHVLGFDYVAQERYRLILALDTVVVFKYYTWRVEDPQATLESWTNCNFFVCPGCAATAHPFTTTMYISSKIENIIQPRETRRRTLAR